jgi:mRNA-degrading endonuclease RelE of RelBE toxin-antitoxin system
VPGISETFSFCDFPDVMVGDDAVWRVRAGDCRILYVVRPMEIIVVDIGNRKDIYR